METTKDYERFKLLEFNRKTIDRRHVNRLKESITKNGYIGNPILVNDDYEIYDGQHRFIALKEMGMEIPFEVQSSSYSSIIDLNITQKRWTMEDYVNYYCEKDKNPNYLRLRRIAKDLNCNLTTVLVMGYRVCTNGHLSQKIKDGSLSFKIDEEIRANKFYEKFSVLAKYLRLKITSKMCIALVNLSTLKGFEWKTMLEKASKYPTLAYNCRTQEEFTVMLRDIYNFNTRLAEKRI